MAVQLFLERGDEMDDGRESNRIVVAMNATHLGGHSFETGQLYVERLVIAIEEMADQLRQGTCAPVEIPGLVPILPTSSQAKRPPMKAIHVELRRRLCSAAHSTAEQRRH